MTTSLSGGAPLSIKTHNKHVFWTVQLLVFIADLDHGCNDKNCLNSFNDALLITIMFVSVLQPNTTFYLSTRWGSIRWVLIYRRRSRVYSQYTRQDCPMGITEKILQYYKVLVRCISQRRFSRHVLVGMCWSACHVTIWLTSGSFVSKVLGQSRWLIIYVSVNSIDIKNNNSQCWILDSVYIGIC